MKYKYAHNFAGIEFTKEEWLHISTKNDPDETNIHIHINMWQNHLQNGTIVLSDVEEISFWDIKSLALDESILRQQKGKDSPGLLIGCTYCHNLHVTEGDGFPSMHLNGDHFAKATKECIQHFNRRQLVYNEM
jgi:hypothetical protein